MDSCNDNVSGCSVEEEKIDASGNAAEVITYHTSWCPQTERRGRPQRTPEEHRWRMTGSGGRT